MVNVELQLRAQSLKWNDTTVSVQLNVGAGTMSFCYDLNITVLNRNWDTVKPRSKQMDHTRTHQSSNNARQQRGR